MAPLWACKFPVGHGKKTRNCKLLSLEFVHLVDGGEGGCEIAAPAESLDHGVVHHLQ